MILYSEYINWEKNWLNLSKMNINRKVKEFQWKCIHRIIYTENRLKIMHMSNGKCHLCDEINNIETLEHLFYQCNNVKPLIETVVRNLQLCNFINDEVLVEKDILLGICTENSSNFIVNAIILYFKWAIWKIRNKCKFDKIKLNVQSIQALLKLHMKNELKISSATLGYKVYMQNEN